MRKPQPNPVVLAAIVCVATASRGHAEGTDETIARLLRRIEQLERKVDALEHPRSAADGVPSPAPKPTAPDPTPAKPETSSRSIPEASTRPAAVVSVGPEGFQARSANTNFAIRIRGLVQMDSRWLVDRGGTSPSDSFLLRRARLVSEGTFYRDLDYQVVTEFGGGTASAQSTTILDANLAYHFVPAISLKAGKFKSPVDLEVLQQDRDRGFIESGFPTQLVPNRDIGVQIYGELAAGRLTYAAGAFNGSADDTNGNNTDGDGKKEFAGRLFATPFAGNEWIGSLGVGVGGSYGATSTPANLPNGGRGTYISETQQPWFTYKSGIVGDTLGVMPDGTHWRISPQGYYYLGPFGLLGEYVLSSQKYRAGNGTTLVPFRFATIDNTAWQITVGYLLTGESATYRGVRPAHDFSLSGGTWGALEAVARYTVLDVDPTAFQGYADPTTSAREARAITTGLNWYLNRNFRVSIDYTLTDYTGGNGAAGNHRSENAILTRFQVAF